ncbi:hypothetical protein E8E13_003092 [Curvularia kusanoi]|uniref:Uncharacterized protein n=1 Tax=Curvularia kusanoi TaxID=90978 RepID=A0A9P4T662_CURKU|nr:hypothetical protein E8E13_003092 [Curvularia kusanoi]
MPERSPSPVSAGPSRKGKQRSHNRDVSEQPTYPSKRVRLHEAGASTEQSQDSDETITSDETMISIRDKACAAISAQTSQTDWDCETLRKLLETVHRDVIGNDRRTKIQAERDQAQKITTALDEINVRFREIQQPDHDTDNPCSANIDRLLALTCITKFQCIQSIDEQEKLEQIQNALGVDPQRSDRGRSKPHPTDAAT